MVITEQQLRAVSPRLAGQQDTITKLAQFGIDSRLRLAHFLAQCAHESGSFAKLSENLNYTKPESIVRVFRTAFDIDHDHVIDPEEIEIAKGFVRQPQKLANRAYANRNGNGDEAGGDGWRFRGRAWIGVTGRNNYAKCSTALYSDDRLLTEPDLLAALPGAALASGWFWQQAGCNPWADADNVAGVSGIVNRGDAHKVAAGLAARAANLKAFRKILGV